VNEQEVIQLAEHIRNNCKFVKWRGLMTIGAKGDLGNFSKMKEMRENLEAKFEEKL
jgi:uncharacterized pyridoxal phosphate-containing UPF0001 family protein